MTLLKRIPVRRYSASVFAAAALVFGALIATFLTRDDGQLRLVSAAVLAATGNEYRVSDPIRLFDHPRLVLESGNLSIRHPNDEPGKKAGGSTPAAGSNGIDLLSTGSAALGVRYGTFRVDLRGRRPMVDMEDPANALPAPIVNALSSGSFKRADLVGCRLEILLDGDRKAVIYDLNAALVRKGGRLHLAGHLRLRGEKVHFDTHLASASVAGDGKITMPVQARLFNDLVSTRFTGKIDLTDEPLISASEANFKVASAAAFARWMGFDWSARNVVERFSADGDLSWSSTMVSFENARFGIDDNTAQGRLSLSYKGVKPALGGTLAFDAIEAHSTIKESELFGGVNNPLEHPRRWFRVAVQSLFDRLGVEGLSTLEADLRVSASDLRIGVVNARDVAATVTIRDGKMLADFVDLTLAGGGRGSLQLEVDTTGHQARSILRSKLERVDLGWASASSFGYPVLTGSGTVIADLSGAGLDYQSFLKTLSGRLVVEADTPVAVSLDLASLVARAKQAERDLTGKPVMDEEDGAVASARGPGAPQRAVIPAWGEGQGLNAGSTSLDTVRMAFSVVDGVAEIGLCEAKAGANILRGRGKVSIADEQLDLQVFVGRHPISATGPRGNANMRAGQQAVSDRPASQTNATASAMSVSGAEIKEDEAIAAPRVAGQADEWTRHETENGDVLNITGPWRNPTASLANGMEEHPDKGADGRRAGAAESLPGKEYGSVSRSPAHPAVHSTVQGTL